MNIKKSILLRVRIAFLFVFLIAIAILIKLIDVQFIHADIWLKKQEKTRISSRDIKATRGNIYSDNGSLLATSLPFYRVAFDPSISKRDQKRKEIFEKDIRELCTNLAAFFGDKSAEAYYRIINDARAKNRQYLLLNARMINYHEKKMMTEWPIFKEGQMNGGIIFQKVDRRFIPFSSLALRTIGYTKIKKDENGKLKTYGAGIEYSFDSLLAGKNGKGLFVNIGGGGWKPVADAGEVKPKAGYDIQTTLDVNLQDVVEGALHDALIKHRADHGCAILMEVETGEIKAITNLSRIKSGRNEGKYVESYNHAVGINNEPGSTFKLASLMALFEATGMKLEDTVYVGSGKHKFYERTMTDAHTTESGFLTVKEVFEQSSNIGVSKLIYKHFGRDVASQQRFIDYLEGFGLSKPLHFQIKGEAIPKVKSTSDNSWSGITLPWMSIGYEVEMSPLQMLTFYNAVANNGKMIQPIIVKYVRDADKVVTEYKPRVINRKICSDKTLKKVREILEGVVDNGTARNIKSDSYKIAGKTGTAQKLKAGKYTKEYYASFVGYFPAETPKYTCIVAIDNPHTLGFYGSEVSAPVFKEIADKVYLHDLKLRDKITLPKPEKGIYPLVQAGRYDKLSYLLSELQVPQREDVTLQTEWVSAKRNDELNVVEWVKKENTVETVPDVRGMTLRDAIYMLENSGFRVKYTGVGRVKVQSLYPGQKVLPGSQIKIELS